MKEIQIVVVMLNYLLIPENMYINELLAFYVIVKSTFQNSFFFVRTSTFGQGERNMIYLGHTDLAQTSSLMYYMNFESEKVAQL